MSQRDPSDLSQAPRSSVLGTAAGPATSRVVGRVAALWRYPVKSMAAEPLDTAEVSWHGLAGDRRWAFIRPGLERSGFPWFTVRERSGMCLYRPSFVDPEKPDTSATMVTTPSGASFDVIDPALAAELGEGVRVIRQSRGVFDTFPLSVLTTASLASLTTLVGAGSSSAPAGSPAAGLAPLRFRPNLLIEPLPDASLEGAAEAALHPERAAFPEDTWVGATLHIGGFAMRVDQRDSRCVMVNVDPVTIERDPSVLRAIASERQSRFGVYGSTLRPGRVAVGDLVTLERQPGSP